MTKPSTLVNITRIIQTTALSIPRDLASRATHTSSAMLSAMKAMGMKIMTPAPTPQVPQAAHVSPSLGGREPCPSAAQTGSSSPREAKAKCLNLVMSEFPAPEA